MSGKQHVNIHELRSNYCKCDRPAEGKIGRMSRKLTRRIAIVIKLILLCLTHDGSLQGQESCVSEISQKFDPDTLVLNLESAISRALNCNRQLMGNVESLTQAQYGIDLAKSDFCISITPNAQTGFVGGDKRKSGWKTGGGVDITKKWTSGTLISVAPSIVKGIEHYSTGVQTTLTQPLLRGLGKEYQLANLHSAQFFLRTAYRSLYIAQVQLLIRTIQTLYEVVKLEKSFLLNLESNQRILQFFKAAKIKEKIGLADSLDVFRAEIEFRHSVDVLKNTQERLEETKDSLRDLLALPLDTKIEVVIPTKYTPHQVDVDKAIEIALKHRIEILQSEDEWRENERLSRLAKKNLYPELNLVLNYSNIGRAKHFGDSWSRRENLWGIGVTTARDGTLCSQQIAYEQSILSLQAASRSIEQTEATLILEVKKAVRQLERAFERVHLQEEQIQTATGELHLAKVKFDRGMTDNFNVLQAEKSLRSAQQSHWIALIDHIVGEFQLLAAMGLLIDRF